MCMTTNEPSVIDEGSFTVRRTIRIEAPIDRVWSAVTDPAHISRWFGRVVLEGTSGTISWPDRAPIPLRVEAFEEPTMVSYRWCNDDATGTAPATMDEAHSTVFTFTLEPITGGTQLTVVETGFETTSDPLSNLRDHQDGWNGELDKLVALLEESAA